MARCILDASIIEKNAARGCRWPTIHAWSARWPAVNPYLSPSARSHRRNTKHHRNQHHPSPMKRMGDTLYGVDKRVRVDLNLID